MGQNLMVNRDVLRRTYGAVKNLGQYFYAAAAPELASQRPLSISFTEAQAGDVVFIVDYLPVTRRRKPWYAADPWRRTSRKQQPRGVHAALHNILLLARAAKFVLEGGTIRFSPTGDEQWVDLTSPQDAQQLRVPHVVARALGDAKVQAHLRELLTALSEQGVSSIVLGSDPQAPERRSECVLPATDRCLEFVAGGPLPC